IIVMGIGVLLDEDGHRTRSVARPAFGLGRQQQAALIGLTENARAEIGALLIAAAVLAALHPFALRSAESLALGVGDRIAQCRIGRRHRIIRRLELRIG